MKLNEGPDPSLPRAGPKRLLKLLSLHDQIEFATSAELGHLGLEYKVENSDAFVLDESLPLPIGANGVGLA